ncbi:hypothetical protein [Streptomyces sp. NPDC001091]
MTAPVIPSPADLARRAHAAAPRPGPAPVAAPTQDRTAADLAGPASLQRGEHIRPMVQKGLRLSRMRPESRLVALTLLGYVNWRTGWMRQHQPTTAELAAATGLTEGQVLVQMEILIQRGWLARYHPATGPRQDELVYRLCIPQVVLQQLRDRSPDQAT